MNKPWLAKGVGDCNGGEELIHTGAHGSISSTPGSNMPLAINAKIARMDWDKLADSGTVRKALIIITSIAYNNNRSDVHERHFELHTQLVSEAKVGMRVCKSLIIFKQGRKFGERELSEKK